ncbi:MAG: YbbR-like domain-containing protein [Bacteroidota bacterium]
MPDSKKSSWRISSRKLSNLKVVVLCCVAATTFWILNALNKDNYNTIVDYPLQWDFDQDNYVAVKPLPKSIQIQISGNGWDLLRKYFNFSAPPFPILLAKPADKNYILTADIQRALSEFIAPTYLENILEDSIIFQIDPIIKSSLTPYLDTTAYSLDKHVELDGQVRFTPDKVEIRGPSSLVEAYQGKFPISLNEMGIKNNFSAKVTLELEDKIVELVQINPSTIQVDFKVLTFLEGNKRLKIKKLNFPKNVSLSNEELIPVITYLVEESKAKGLAEMEFEAVLDYKKRNRADSTLKITLNPAPSYLKDIRIDPPQVKLRYD